MQKLLICLAVLSVLSLGNHAIAQTTQSSQTNVDTGPIAPTEVGTTTMPPGQYSLTEVNTGKKYSLTVTDKGTMIFAAATAPATAASTPATSSTSGLTGLAEKEIGQGVGGLVEKQGMSELKKFMK